MQAYPIPWWGWLLVVVLILICISLVSLIFEVGRWLIEKDRPDDRSGKRPTQRR